ncbi:MAG: AzlD domain-containing protein [Anaerolineae bacterium]|nr:AzlD domain-containing protein [Anaerolineae bacterium]
MKIWLIIVLGGILTYLIRLSFILLFGQMKIPALAQRSLRFIPPAVLSAIIFPELLVQSGQVNLSAGNLRLLAGLVAALVAWRTRNAVLTILAGMGALLALQALL